MALWIWAIWICRQNKCLTATCLCPVRKSPISGPECVVSGAIRLADLLGGVGVVKERGRAALVGSAERLIGDLLNAGTQGAIGRIATPGDTSLGDIAVYTAGAGATRGHQTHY